MSNNIPYLWLLKNPKDWLRLFLERLLPFNITRHYNDFVIRTKSPYIRSVLLNLSYLTHTNLPETVTKGQRSCDIPYTFIHLQLVTDVARYWPMYQSPHFHQVSEVDITISSVLERIFHISVSPFTDALDSYLSPCVIMNYHDAFQLFKWKLYFGLSLDQRAHPFAISFVLFQIPQSLLFHTCPFLSFFILESRASTKKFDIAIWRRRSHNFIWIIKEG